MIAETQRDFTYLCWEEPEVARLLGASPRSIVRAVKTLEDGNWLQRVVIHGTVSAYVLNDRVSWSQSREKLRYSAFSATVIAASDEQPESVNLDDKTPLKQLPRQAPDEKQLPTGDGLPPVSQPFLDGMEPELPAIRDAGEDG